MIKKISTLFSYYWDLKDKKITKLVGYVNPIKKIHDKYLGEHRHKNHRKMGQ
jgi:hypothetical protein